MNVSNEAGENMAETAGTILIVEDQPELAAVLEYHFQSQGFATLHAENGLSACRLAGSEQPDLILLDILLPDLDGWEVCRLIRGRRDEAIGSVPIIMLTALGSMNDRLRGLELGADAFIPKPYSVREVVLTSRRLIERRQRERQLSGAVTRLQAQGDQERAIQDILCHELRNQLLILRGYSGLLGRPEVGGSDRSSTCIAAIERSSRTLGNLAESLLLLSRCAAEGLCLPSDRPEVVALCREILDLYRPLADQRRMGLELETSVAAARPELNSLGLRLILSNLVENALKYAPEGTPVMVRLAHPPGSRLELAVEDCGLGIAEADRERIFQRFARGGTLPPEVPGSGLGLYIVHTLAGVMRGEVRVEDREPAGSRFVVSFPTRQ
jgi:two-component system, sensor histidine kinase and response regulator